MMLGQARVWPPWLGLTVLLALFAAAPVAASGLDLANSAVRAAQAGDLDRAIELYDRAIVEGGLTGRHLATVHNNRGFVRQSRGDYDGALDDYAAALEIVPDYVGVYDNRGWLYRERGEPMKAIEDYTRALEVDPGYANGYNNRGLARLDVGAYAEAVADFEKAIELGLDGPRAAWPHNNRGFAFARMGALDRAIDAYDRAIEVDPGYPDSYFNRGDAYALKREFRRAAADYTKVVELDPDHPAAYGHRGAVWERLGNYESALWDYRRQRERAGETEWLAERLASIRDYVRETQAALHAHGYDVGPIDGIPGSMTREAIRAFQESRGMEVDGRLSRRLLERLKE